MTSKAKERRAILDQTLSVRPLALEIARMQTHPLPLAVNGVPREIEYGLTFYRNQLTIRYEWGSVPPEEHLLVAPENSLSEISKQVAGRHVSFLGHYAPQHVDYFWIAAAGLERTTAASAAYSGTMPSRREIGAVRVRDPWPKF